MTSAASRWFIARTGFAPLPPWKIRTNNLTPVSLRLIANVLWLAYSVIFLTAIALPLRSLGKAAMQVAHGMACIFSLIEIISNRAAFVGNYAGGDADLRSPSNLS